MPQVYHYNASWDNACGTLPEYGIDIAYYPNYENRSRIMHSVDVPLLSCVLGGTGTHYMDTDAYEEHGVSVGIINYGQEHDIVTETPMEIVNLFLDPTRIRLPVLPGVLQRALPRILPLHRSLGNRLNRMVHIPISADVPIREVLMAMRMELLHQRLGFHDSVRNLLSVFFTICGRAAIDSGVVTAGGSEDPRMEELRLHIDAHYAESIRLEDLSDRAGMSRTYLCRRFKSYSGQSVFTYLIQRRLEAAVVRLRASDEKIASVASDCGFSDLAFFNRKFRAQFGMSPGEYRREHGSA